MATFHKRTTDLAGNGDDTAIHRRTTNKTLPPRLRRRRSRRSSAYRVFQTRAIKGLFVLVLGWIVGLFAVYFGYFGSITMPTGAGGMLPVSPYSSKQMPVNINIQHNTIQHAPNHNTTIHHVSHHTNNKGYESPLLIFTCNRPNYLNKTLENIYATISQPCGFGCPIIVSEDGEHRSNQELLLSFKKRFEAKGIPLIHIQHKKRKFLKGEGNAYNKLAIHYGWALSQVFDGTAINNASNSQQQQHSLPQRVVILEEDIKVAPDFFSYMESTSSLLDHDPTLFAVSSFNDNGHLENGDPKRLLRSDFFPGLGWMMTRDLWKNELESKWPDGYWDDWLRLVEQRKDRQVIRPEVSRTYHFGSEGGTSGNQFGAILERVNLNEKDIQWNMEDLSYLDNSLYENQYTKLVMSSKLVNTIEEAKHMSEAFNVRIEYGSFSDFSRFARELGIMDDEKVFVPRTAYKGIVEVRQGTSLLFLTPKGGFEGYKKKSLRKTVTKHITKHITKAKESFFHFLFGFW